MEYSQIDLYEFLTESELQHYYNGVKNELKITNAAQFKYATDEDLKSIGMSRPEIRRLRKFYDKHFPHGYLSKIKRLLQTPAVIGKRDETNGAASLAQSTLMNSSESLAMAKATNSPGKVPNNKHIIPADSITVNKQLGTGEFGIVQQGVWTNGTERIQVAIKCLCRERMLSNPMEFLKEAAIMHSIEHENIVRLYGVVLATDSLMLVTELAHLRSLLECLKDPGLRVSFLTIPTLCEFAMQICNGMRYLENKRLIHRDLAARNILVFSKNKVKISDFGLSRALGVGKDYYKTNFNVNLKLPIAWCAPECINYLRFTNGSDVWAFGVCLWEMFSYGFQPWAALTGLEILEAIDAPNYQRLEQPECCPREYYTLMMKCWQDDATKRPKFSEIYEMLPDMKPEQLKAIVNCCELKKDHLLYRQGEIITVLDRNTGTPFWKGVLNSGKTGFFNPSNTVAYLEGLPSANRDFFVRANERSSKRKLRTEMISKPQNDLKHTGHVGIDGASFGDVAFLSNTQNYNHVPHQIVTPYKPSEDIEQTPLLLPPTPTSPDSQQTASGYFSEANNAHPLMNPSFVSSTENTPKRLDNDDQSKFKFPGQSYPGINFSTNPFTHKLDDDLSASTFAMQNSSYFIDGQQAAAAPWKTDNEQHEYHEISDDEITADKLDFGPSLLDEINSMFGSISTSIGQRKSPDFEGIQVTESTSTHKVRKCNSSAGETTASKVAGSSSSSSKKKGAGSVKQISVKDEKILNQAIEIANEISARSMTDLVSDNPSSAQSPKRKFSFRFPHLSNNGMHDKSHPSPTSSLAGGVGHSGAHGKGSSPYSKKKNFTEELQNIPDLQRYRSLSEIKSDIRIPLFDKESSDFCFEKSREILSRPLNLEPLGPTESFGDRPPNEPKTINENIMDIENTLKALNLDFMQTYTELDRTDSDETILNEHFTSIVSSLDDEISSISGSLKSSGLNSAGLQTTFDFDAATNHLNKHLHYINSQMFSNNASNFGSAAGSGAGTSVDLQDHKLADDKRSSTPDTGFASRDTNISLSRRSSQKSNYSPPENFFNASSAIGKALYKEDSGGDLMAKHLSRTSPLHSGPPSGNRLKIDDQKRYRPRAMSQSDKVSPISPVLSEPQIHVKRSVGKAVPVPGTPLKADDYFNRRGKSRSVRARTLRRLSYNPIVINSSSSTDDDESDCPRSVARSECDIRARTHSNRRRPSGLPRKAFSNSHDDTNDPMGGQNKLYGSNASIKSAPHYNYGGRSINSTYSAKNSLYDRYACDERIYDFGGRGAAAASIVSTNASQMFMSKTAKQFAVSGPGLASSSGSSSAASSVAPFNSHTRNAKFSEFDVTRLTGKSPTSNYMNSSPEDRQVMLRSPPKTLALTTDHQYMSAKRQQKQQQEFQWPEKIHASTVKQNELLWRQQQHQQHQQQQPQKSPFLSVQQGHLGAHNPALDSDEFEYRSGNTPHIPPSPAP